MIKTNQNKQVVVSMTSFPKAIPYAIKTIRSLVKMSVIPDKLILYLTFSQFGESGIPNELFLLSEEYSFFEIRDYPTDIRSYRKLIPALLDFPEAIIVTVDDDVSYHKHMLRDLLTLHLQIPQAVIAHRVKKINLKKPYCKWKKYRWYNFITQKIYKRYSNLQTGVGGVLYPPHSLKTEMLKAELFTKIAPTTDDIWFWAAAVANKYPIIPVPFGFNKPHGLNKPKELSLKTINFKGKIDHNTLIINEIINLYPDIKERLNTSYDGNI